MSEIREEMNKYCPDCGHRAYSHNQERFTRICLGQDEVVCPCTRTYESLVGEKVDRYDEMENQHQPLVREKENWVRASERLPDASGAFLGWGIHETGIEAGPWLVSWSANRQKWSALDSGYAVQVIAWMVIPPFNHADVGETAMKITLPELPEDAEYWVTAQGERIDSTPPESAKYAIVDGVPIGPVDANPTAVGVDCSR